MKKMILKSKARKKERPVFSYAHFLLPHGQFYRDSSGAFNPIERVLIFNT
ncbi:MAG: hypothetical protein IPG38_09345 [Chitinophagaceae bacterium]|nr:hypothetical protein [Chitinophagaceae bacterium]